MKKIQTLKQIMQANKMAFDYNYTMMMTAFEQNKYLLNTFLNQSADIPAETQSAIEEWLQMYRKGCEDLKKFTDEGYQTAKNYINSTEK
ncbi:MAG: hypothetical protein ABIJ59_07215 [Pseudomonadota bacterium]